MKNKLIITLCVGLLSCKANSVKKNYVADVYIDGIKTTEVLVKEDRVLKAVYFNGKNPLEEINYLYTASGELSKITFSNNDITGSNTDMEMKIYKDAVVQKEVLDSFRVFVPYYILNLDVLGDISYLLSNTEIFKDSTINQTRIFTIDSINKKFRFYPSELDRFITTDELVEKYTINLKNDTLVKEEIVFDKGILKRSYHFENENTLVIKIVCEYIDGEKSTTEKKIVIR